MKDSTKAQLALMGKLVTVTTELHRFVDLDGVVTYPQAACIPRAGWVTGFKYVREGVVHHTRSYHSIYDGDDEVEPGYLDVKRTVPCWLVTYWPTMKPVLVPYGGFEDGGEPVAKAPSIRME